jgi:hypothetical protein
MFRKIIFTWCGVLKSWLLMVKVYRDMMLCRLYLSTFGRALLPPASDSQKRFLEFSKEQDSLKRLYQVTRRLIPADFNL